MADSSGGGLRNSRGGKRKRADRGSGMLNRAAQTLMSNRESNLAPGTTNPAIGFTQNDFSAPVNPYTPQGQSYLNTPPVSAAGTGVQNLNNPTQGAMAAGSAGAGYTGAPTQNQQNFGNEYYWNTPEFALGLAMNGLGMSTDTNSSFYNAMQDLAPGLKWMSLLGGGPTGGMADFTKNVAGWMGQPVGSAQNAGYGRLSGLGNMVNTLVGGGTGNPALEGYIDSLDPRQMVQAITSMMQTSGYGQIAPELVGGMANRLGNLYNQFGINGGSLLSNLGPGQSDMDVFRQYLQNQGGDILSYFNNPF